MSEQKKKPIPKEELTAYERWEVPAMESGHVVVPGGRRSGRDEEQQAKPLTAEEIEAIRQAAHEEGRSEGHAEGYEAGKTEGLAAARKEIDAQLARLRAVSEALLAPIEAEKEQIEESLMLLVAQLARQVVARELSLDSSQLRGLVDESIAALPAGSDRIRIAVSPDDLQLVQDYEPELEQECRFRADSSLLPGGCRVETEFSLIDYSVDARFRSAAAAMVGERYDQLEALLKADLAEQKAAPAVKPDVAPADSTESAEAATGGAETAGSEAEVDAQSPEHSATEEPDAAVSQRSDQDEQAQT